MSFHETAKDDYNTQKKKEITVLKMEITKSELRRILYALSRMMSVSGSEDAAEPALSDLVGAHFDSCTREPNGGYLFSLPSRKPDAPTLLIDTHFDEVGFLVTEILDGGLLRVAAVGGIDTRLLPAAKILVYGEETIPAYFASTPPHLRKPDEGNAAPKLETLLLDTGMKTDTLQTLVRVGTPCGFASAPCDLLFDAVAGHGFDNKACCAAAIVALASCDREKLAYHVVLHLAGREEVGEVGARTGAFAVKPDLAVVLDAEFAWMPGMREDRTVFRGAGPSLTHSPVCDRRLTARLAGLCKKHGLPCQHIAYPNRTGTDCDVLNITASGVPCALIGIPLTGMHTAEEIVSLTDLETTARLLRALLEEEAE